MHNFARFRIFSLWDQCTTQPWPIAFCDLRSRKIKQTFFTQINTLLDWQPIIEILKKHYTKGQSATG
ncbi:MAG: hypothetical protein ACI9SG_002209, partial [Maribacter sp.]